MFKTILNIISTFKKSVGRLRFYSIYFFMGTLSIILSLEPLFFWKIIQKLEEFYAVWSFDISWITNIVILWTIFVITSQIVKYIIWHVITTDSILIDYKKNIKQYCENTLDMSMNEYLWKRIGGIYKMIDRGTDNRLYFLFAFFERYYFSIVSITAIVVVMLLMHVQMALISLLLLPVMLWLGYYFSTVTTNWQRELSKQWEEIFVVVGNAMSSFSLYKTLWLRNSFLKEIHERTDSTYMNQMRLNRSWNFSDIYTVVLIMISRILVLASWLYYIQAWTLTLAELFVIFSYISWIYFPLWFMFSELRTSVRQLTEYQIMLDELWSIEQEDLETWKSLSGTKWDIEFKNVSFGYSQEKQILKNISLTGKKWKKIALVWDTGAGKSTIVNLLLRFWDTNSGEILLDWINIQELSKTSLRNVIWVVSQDNSLFNLSIKENLKFANPKASRKDLEDALKKAEAHFVFDLPNGIKTVIWERGLKLSGGEKQRISIARLFLKNPEILLLDEATSALDNKTEKLIQKSLERLMKGKTSIIIAHRLSTIRHADVIYMLEAGRVIESGNYDELMKKKEKFYELANPDKLILW